MIKVMGRRYVTTIPQTTVVDELCVYLILESRGRWRVGEEYKRVVCTVVKAVLPLEGWFGLASEEKVHKKFLDLFRVDCNLFLSV